MRTTDGMFDGHLPRHGQTKPLGLDEFLLGVLADCDPDLLLVEAPLVDMCEGCEGVCTCGEVA